MDCCFSMKSITLATSATWVTKEVDRSENSPSYAFDRCESVETIYIKGDYHKKVGFTRATFRSCSNVSKLYCNSFHPPYVGINNIDQYSAINFKKCHLYIPEGCTDEYKSRFQWGKFPKENIHELTQ